MGPVLGLPPPLPDPPPPALNNLTANPTINTLNFVAMSFAFPASNRTLPPTSALSKTCVFWLDLMMTIPSSDDPNHNLEDYLFGGGDC